jgi:hypothetical protein
MFYPWVRHERNVRILIHREIKISRIILDLDLSRNMVRGLIERVIGSFLF